MADINETFKTHAFDDLQLNQDLYVDGQSTLAYMKDIAIVAKLESQLQALGDQGRAIEDEVKNID